MLKKEIKTTCILCLAMLTSACNSNLEITQSIIPSMQKPIFVSIFSCIIIAPIVSIMLITLSSWKNLAFKVSLQRYLHLALVLMLALAWIVELKLTDNLPNLLSSKIIIFSLLFQLLLVVGAYISLKKQQIRDKKQRYFL